jgi:AcrR family transcriptional regulator
MANSGTASRVRPREAAGESDTRRVLIDAAVETLKVDGIARASARTIAGRAGCNQGLVFYHFGSVANLLLAALDAVSDGRLEHYGAAVGSVGSPTELVEVAASIFREDLDAGYVSVPVEMIAGSASIPGLGAEVDGRIAPWMRFAQQTVETALADSPLGSVPPSEDVTVAVVALYLGLEMPTHLDGDRSPPLALFEHAERLAALFAAMTGPTAVAGSEGTGPGEAP